jgi:sporulation protein YabP
MNSTQKGNVKLTDRETLSVDGVVNVGSFDENFVTIATSLGELNVEGESLKIENLSNERGEIFIRGKINAVYYKDKVQKRRKSRE